MTASTSDSSEEPLQVRQAIEHKEAGNTFFKAKETGKAIREYHRALMIAKGLQVELLLIFDLTLWKIQNTPAALGLPNRPEDEEDIYAPHKDTIDQLVTRCYSNLGSAFGGRRNVTISVCITADTTRTPEDYMRAFDYCQLVIDTSSPADDGLPKLKGRAKVRQALTLRLARKYERAINMYKTLIDDQGVLAFHAALERRIVGLRDEQTAEAREGLRLTEAAKKAEQRATDDEIGRNLRKNDERMKAKEHAKAANQLGGGAASAVGNGHAMEMQ